jgi:hypothetical protein
MGDTIPKTGADKRQVGIAVAGLHYLLGVCQLGPQVHLIVTVLGSLWEQSPESSKELPEQVEPIVHPQGQAAVEVSRGRMWRAKEDTLIAFQDIAGFADPGSNIESFKSALWRKRES